MLVDSQHQAEDQHQHLVVKTDNTKRVDPNRFVILTLFKKNRGILLLYFKYLLLPGRVGTSGETPQRSAIRERCYSQIDQ